MTHRLIERVYSLIHKIFKENKDVPDAIGF